MDIGLLVKRETDQLVDSILKIGKDGDWNQITALLFSFQDLVNGCVRDHFSSVPQDICRLIFGYLSTKDRFSLSITNKRFHSFEWLESISKKESLKYYDRLVSFPKELFVFAIERFGISWRSIAHCFSRPRKNQTSFRRYKNRSYSYAERMESFKNGDQKKVDCLLIGNILNDSEEVNPLYLSSMNPGVVVIESLQIMFGDHCAFLEKGVLFAGVFLGLDCDSSEDDDNDNDDGYRVKLEGYMEWPDGYSFSGRGRSMDYNNNFCKLKFIEEPIHPKIKECLEKNMCTKFAGVVGPQTFKILNSQAYCLHCTESCKQEDGETKWSYCESCTCQCERIESKKRKEPPN
eukprot:TRINITY_DN2523_c0_g4_i1.p1 TRINITY_DN2523_c0_g4~~TRINITY_DN2523_c0_g4_i1.p1  ORF type:complete len:370 (+),score=40.54 TRINITY_DN2523_c0_g4_i1:71-1111(+)